MDKTKPIDATQLEDLKQLYAEAVAISPLPWTRKGDEFDDWGMVRGTKTEENPLGNMPIASTVNEAHFGDWRDAMYARTKGRVLEGEESVAYDAEWKAGPPQAIALAEAIVQIMNAFPALVSAAARSIRPVVWSELPCRDGDLIMQADTLWGQLRVSRTLGHCQLMVEWLQDGWSFRCASVDQGIAVCEKAYEDRVKEYCK